MGGGGRVRGLKHFYSWPTSPWVPMLLNTEVHKNSVRIKAPNTDNASKRKPKSLDKQRRVLWLILLCSIVNENQ